MFGLLMPNANSATHRWDGHDQAVFLQAAAPSPIQSLPAPRDLPRNGPAKISSRAGQPGKPAGVPVLTPSHDTAQPRAVLKDPAAHLRAEWETKYAHLPLPPPPPAFFPNREELIKTAKSFAEEHGYALVIGHSTKGTSGDKARVWLMCELAGIYRNRHKLKEDERKRHRASRKIGCPMKIQGAKYEFGSGWLLSVKHAEHNHGPIVKEDDIHHDAEWPDLEQELFNWHQTTADEGQTIHGNTIKAKAIELWHRMPQYLDQPVPDFTMQWMNDYRRRYGFRVRPTRKEYILPKGSEAPPNIPAAEDVLAVADEEKRTMESLPISPDFKRLFDSSATYVKRHVANSDAAHDWSQVLRVLRLTNRILMETNAAAISNNHFSQFVPHTAFDMPFPRNDHMPPFHANIPPSAILPSSSYDNNALLLAALLHPIGEKKYLPINQDDAAEPGENQIAEVLLERGAPDHLALKVQALAKSISPDTELKNPRHTRAILAQHPELAVLLDAERLETMGAVGIARAFVSGRANGASGGLRALARGMEERARKMEGGFKTDAGRRLAREKVERVRAFKGWWDEECSVGM